MVVWYHLTPFANVESIRQQGLRPVMGRTWLMTKERMTPEFCEHIARHQDCFPCDLDLLEILLPREFPITQCQGKWAGFALVYHTIPPEYIRSVKRGC